MHLDQQLDGNLFRRGPVDQLEQDTTFSLHPLLEATDCITSWPMFFRVRPYDWNDERELNAFDYSVKAGYATSPACKAMVFFMDVDSFEIEDDNGITVQKLLEELSEFWTGCSKEKYDKADAEDKRLAWKLADTFCLYEHLGDHNGWTGWHEPFLRDDGFVQMEGGPYDS